MTQGVSWSVLATAGCTNSSYTTEDACDDACADCADYFPASDGMDKRCECPCPEWAEEVAAYCNAAGSQGDTTNADLIDLLEDYDEAKCDELSSFPPIWTDADDAGYELLQRKDGKTVERADTDAAGDSGACSTTGGVWTGPVAREAAPLTGQAAIDTAGECRHYTRGCPATSTGYGTEDALEESPEQDWSANSEFAAWKTWVASRFNWLYIGSQDVWIVFIVIVYFSKHSSMKLCAKDEEDQPPEYSDASWFTMLFCSGIGVGLFYFGVAEPVWHYTDQTNRYNTDASLTDAQVAQDAMNLTFFHWGLHGFVVYTLVGLMLGIVAHRWGMPMTMKTCFYPLLGDKVFGRIGDMIDTLSVITTLFGVCTSLGLGVMQLATGLERLTEGSIRNTTGTQVVIVWCITLIATVSVVSGIKNGIQRLSNVAFTMGLMILFVGFYIGDTWYFLNVFVQSVGYYIQYVIQLGTVTSAFATTPFELLDAHGVDLSPATSPADIAADDDGNGGITHPTTTEHQKWMDWWTLFYWGWWIAWSPFVGTFMAKISKGRTVGQFILGSCIGPITFGFIWFSVFGSAGISMVRDAAANGIDGTTGPQVVAVLEKSQLPLNGALRAGMTQSTGWVMGACEIQDQVHDCAATEDCEFEYLKAPSLIVGIQGRSKEDMWYDMMLSYGEPDGFMGWMLYVFSMLALVLYFVTSSDSGSLVIDILAANGVEEPPVVQRIFWACMEGLTATALLIAGGSSALNALSTVSIVAGLPYTMLLCFICASTWRALQMDAAYAAGDMSGPGPQFSLELADIFCKPMETVPNGSKPTIVAFLINTVCPPLAISSHNNIFYTIVSTVLWLAFIVLHFVEIGAQGWWAMAWMSYTMMALIVWDVRGKARATHGVTGNMIEDFFAALLFHGGVLTQVVAGAELAADDLKTASA
eukprot:COSAG06_NODE_367_length_16758_cov_27.111651_7_plen_925_part_00